MKLGKVLSHEKMRFRMCFTSGIGVRCGSCHCALMGRRDRKGAMDSYGKELCDFHLINVDCLNSAWKIWLGSGYFSPTASSRARVTPTIVPEAWCSLLSTIRADYTVLHCLRTMCNHLRLMKEFDSNMNLSVLIWQFYLFLAFLSPEGLQSIMLCNIAPSLTCGL